MSLLLESTLKVSLIVLSALAVTAVLRHRSAALRHWTLSAAIASAVVAPFLQPIAPSWTVQVNTPAAIQSLTQPRAAGGSLPQSAGAAGLANARASALEGLDIGRLLGSVWLLGAGVGAIVLFAGFARLTWIAARAERIGAGRWADLAERLSTDVGLRRPVQLLQSDHPTLLVTWGLARPKVLLPASARTWSKDRIRVVLLHELAHIRRGDWATQMAAECLRAAYWFNPLVWIAARRLRQESEHACDDAVLGGGVEAPEYATHLLDLARSIREERQAWFPAPAMARPSSLERRFSAMLNSSTNRSPLTRRTRLATMTAVVAITVLVAGLGAAQTFVTFSGSVFDPSNRVLPGVKLVLTNSQSQAKHEVKTDRTGRFEFVGLPPGDYAWETELMGFAKLKGTVTVVGRDVQRDLALQVGSLEETITISASASAATAGNPGRPVVRGQSRASREAPACTPSPEAVGGNIRPPNKLVDVRPQYPENLRLAGTGGVIVLDTVINTEGTVGGVRVVSGDPNLAAAAIEAVRGWEFSQTLLNCEPIEVRMKVTANFVIQP